MLPVAVHKIIITQVKFSFSVRVAGMENLTLVGWLPDHVVLRLATKIWQPVRPFVRSASLHAWPASQLATVLGRRANRATARLLR